MFETVYSTIQREKAMKNGIDGVYFHLTAAEAVNHYTRRAEWHEKKAAEAETQLGHLAESIEAAKVAVRHGGGTTSYMNAATDDPLDGIKDRIEKRRTRAGRFRFLAAHVPKGVTFTVSACDVYEMEFGLDGDDPDSPFGRRGY